MSRKTLQSGFAPLIILGLIAILGMGGAGVAAASDSARPGDALYTVDQFTERVKMAFMNSPEAQAKFLATLASERLEEAQSLAEENRVAHVEQALTRFEEHLAAAQKKAAEAKARGKNVDEIQALLAENTLKHQETLEQVFEKVPEEAQPAIERALEVSKRGYEEALEAVSKEKKEEVIKNTEERMENVQKKLRERGIDLKPMDMQETEGSHDKPENSGEAPKTPTKPAGKH
jgi:adenosylmethionine-8-amino-7-oxononanoate aminotransferase